MAVIGWSVEGQLSVAVIGWSVEGRLSVAAIDWCSVITVSGQSHKLSDEFSDKSSQTLLKCSHECFHAVACSVVPFQWERWEKHIRKQTPHV